MAAEAHAVVPDDDSVDRLVRSGAFREATAVCARLYGGRIGRLCMAMVGSQAEADELVQETLLVAHDGLSSWRGEGTVKSWLYGIARRLCARRLESRSIHDRRLKLVAGGEEDGTQQDVALDALRRARRVREALARIKPSEREALLLRYEADLSYREIGQICGLSEVAARKRASRGLEELRAILDRKDI